MNSATKYVGFVGQGLAPAEAFSPVDKVGFAKQNSDEGKIKKRHRWWLPLISLTPFDSFPPRGSLELSQI